MLETIRSLPSASSITPTFDHMAVDTSWERKVLKKVTWLQIPGMCFVTGGDGTNQSPSLDLPLVRVKSVIKQGSRTVKNCVFVLSMRTVWAVVIFTSEGDHAKKHLDQNAWQLKRTCSLDTTTADIIKLVTRKPVFIILLEVVTLSSVQSRDISLFSFSMIFNKQPRTARF